MTIAEDRATVLGTCHHDCPDSCGWVATVERGTVVELKGNPDHPYSAGELCPKVNRFVARSYHPDRILTPLIRTGPKGAGDFREATWDEAVEQVVTRVRDVIDRHGGEAVLPWWDAGTQGMIQMSSLDRRFFAGLGASQLTGSLCGATSKAGYASTYGSGRSADPMDIAHAEVVILWGTNTRLTNRHLWPFVEQAGEAGGQLVVVDPLRTVTADAADLFVQPLPGTDVALMLGLMHVLIRDQLVDEEYVAENTVGFAALRDHVAGWTPQRAAEVCGLDASEVEELAARYGSTRRAFIRTLIGAEHHEHGAMFFRALGCLPLLTGAWRERGGGLSRSVGSWPDVAIDDSVFDPVVAPTTRSINMNHLGRALTDRNPDEGGIHALFVWCGNPVVSVPNAAAVRTGLAREDLFCVVSEQFLTDTANYADVVFPAATQLEQLDVVPSWGHLYLGWNEPAVAPLGEAVPDTELWRRLAAAFGIDDPMFELDDEALVRLALRPSVDVEELRARGWVRLDVFDPLLPYADGQFATASGRAEFESDALAQLGLPALPTYTPAVEVADPDLSTRYPLLLATPKRHVRFLNSTYSQHHGDRERGPFIELHAVDAAARGLADGDVASVLNDRATLTLPVQLTDRVRPGLVAIPWGWWGPANNVNALTNDTLTDWGGGVAYGDTRVEVSPSPGPDLRAQP